MSIFLQTNHLFVRTPGGNVEDVARMRDAGFGAIFCNIGDHAPEAWNVVRDRARAAGVVCGPWLRTADASNRFDFDRFHALLRCADAWGTPLIVNSESELQGSGTELTTYIDAQLGGRDAAISVEPWPFDNVGWWPFADRVVMPQHALSVASYDEQGLRDVWHAYGVKCVVLTYGSFDKTSPSGYARLAPFGVYTADDCANDYAAWRAVGTTTPCASPPDPPPDPEDDMQTIGTNDGVAATLNRLRTLDPAGTILKPDAKGKYPADLSSLDGVPLDQWKAYDKLQRSLKILVADHDELAKGFEA